MRAIDSILPARWQQAETVKIHPAANKGLAYLLQRNVTFIMHVFLNLKGSTFFPHSLSKIARIQQKKETTEPGVSLPYVKKPHC
jgi:hypothetical protein